MVVGGERNTLQFTHADRRTVNVNLMCLTYKLYKAVIAPHAGGFLQRFCICIIVI